MSKVARVGGKKIPLKVDAYHPSAALHSIWELFFGAISDGLQPRGEKNN